MKGENIQRVIAGREQQVPLVCFAAELLHVHVCFCATVNVLLITSGKFYAGVYLSN